MSAGSYIIKSVTAPVRKFGASLADVAQGRGGDLVAGVSGLTMRDVVFRVPTMAALRALALPALSPGRQVLVNVSGYHAAGDLGGGVFRWVDDSVADDDAGLIVIPDALAPTDPGRWLRVHDGAVRVTWFGARGDGGDDYAAIVAAMSCGAKRIIFNGGLTYCVSSGIPQERGTAVEFEGGTWLKLTAPFYTAWGFYGGSSARTDLINANIDCNLQMGANGIGIGGSGGGDVENLYVTAPTVINARRQPDHTSTYNGGGRAIMCESNAKDVHIITPKARNCTAALAFQCSKAHPADRVTVINPSAADCMHAGEFYDLADNADTPNDGSMGGINILGGYAYRCGRAFAADDPGIGPSPYYSGTGTVPDAPDLDRTTGVVIGERARWVRWTGLVVHNPAAYGAVGSIWRGTGFHVHVEAQFIGSAHALVDCTVDAELLPIGGSLVPGTPAGLQTINSRDMRFTVDGIGAFAYGYRCDTPDAVSTGHGGHEIKARISGTLTNLIDVPIARSDAFGDFYNTATGERRLGNFAGLVSGGNAFSGAGMWDHDGWRYAGTNVFSGPVFLSGLPASASGLLADRVFKIDRGDGTSDLRVKN